MLDESERRETMRLLLCEVLLLLNWENNHRGPRQDWIEDYEREQRQKLCELLGRLVQGRERHQETASDEPILVSHEPPRP